MISSGLISLALGSITAGGLTPSVAPADEVQVAAAASSGTGLSLAGTGGEALRSRSPAFVNIETGFRLDTLSWLELSPGIQLELEDRVGFAVLPRFRAFMPLRNPRRFSLFALVGAPIFVHPYTLFGVQAGFGGGVNVVRQLWIVGDLSATAFVGGTDLVDGSALVKLDFSLGVRVEF